MTPVAAREGRLAPTGDAPPALGAATRAATSTPAITIRPFMPGSTNEAGPGLRGPSRAGTRDGRSEMQLVWAAAGLKRPEQTLDEVAVQLQAGTATPIVTTGKLVASRTPNRRHNETRLFPQTQ